MACAGHTAVVLGLMKRALQEIATIALSKKRLGYAGVVGEHPAFLHEFGMQEALYQAVRAYVMEVYTEAVETVERGESLTPEQSARFPQSRSGLTKRPPTSSASVRSGRAPPAYATRPFWAVAYAIYTQRPGSLRSPLRSSCLQERFCARGYLPPQIDFKNTNPSRLQQQATVQTHC